MPRIDPETGLKECSKCHVKYGNPFEAFSVNAFTSDYLQSSCRECAKKSRKTSPNRAKLRYDSDTNFRSFHLKRTAILNRKRYREDPAFRKYKINWNAARRRDLLKDGTVTLKALKELFKTWTGICPVCKKESLPTIDHIIPISKGGIHSISNLQLMCLSCNSRKSNK